MQIDTVLKKIATFSGEEDAVTAIEYGLLAALIFSVIVGSVTLVGTNVAALYAFVAGLIP